MPRSPVADPGPAAAGDAPARPPDLPAPPTEIAPSTSDLDALNRDLPYDRFLIEQLAGDLLPAESLGERRRQLIATGFLALGPTDIIVPEGEKLMMDRVDEQIDVTTRAMLGLTVACARCHDHKYEPVTMRDYYALAGVFYSTETLSGQRRGNYVADDDLRLLPNREGRTTPVPGVHSMADLTREHRTGGWRDVRWTTDPNLAIGAAEGRIADCPLRRDGEAHRRELAPPRGDFRFAGLAGLDRVPDDRSGRLELARWIAAPDNPLTARVMANRVWLHLLGRPLVATVDNFGLSGEPPSHPELLDHLAAEFRQSWSVKRLIRTIVLSRTYRLSSDGRWNAAESDAAAALFGRATLRRLEVEPLRDAMLAVAGRLELTPPTGIQVAGVGGKGRWGQTRSLLDIHSPCRTVYLPVLRQLLPEMHTTFDFPNPTQVVGRREVTTVATQALTMMNSDFAVDCARAAAGRITQLELTDRGRVRLAYLRLLGRDPERQETDDALALLDSLSGDESYRWTALVQAIMMCGEFRSLR